MSEVNLSAMQQARQAIAKGDVARARQLLRHIVNEEPDNYRAWLWLAGITESPGASLQYAQRAATLAPEDETVQDALRWAERRVRDAAVSHTPPAERLVARLPRATGGAPPLPLRDPALMPPPAATAPSPAPAAPLRAQPLAAAEESAAPDVPHTRRRVSAMPQPTAAAAGRRWLSWLGYLALVIVVVVIVLLILQALSPQRALAPVADELAALTPAALTPAALTPAAVVGGFADQRPQPSPSSIAAGSAVGVAAAAMPDAAGRAPLRAKQAIRAANIPAWTPTPLPTPLPTPTLPPDVDPQLFDEPRWIDVNLTTQMLTAFENGRVVYRTAVSSGLPGTPTVTGQYRIYLRLVSQNMSGYHLGFDYFIPNVPHVMYFYDNFALHGAYWHNSFGQPMSHGCVNLSPVDAEWLFNFADVGTLVNVHY